jgi:DMSO reductase anchor subunit
MTMIVTPRTRARLAWAALLVVAALWLAPGLAAQQAADSAAADTAAAEAAPQLDYTFTWPTFLFCAGLVVGYYVFVLRISDREFRGIIAERFGPARGGAGGTQP